MRRSAVIAAVFAVGLSLTGCGSSSLDNNSGKKAEVKTSVSKEASAMVPQALKDKGTLTVGSDASYAPSEFLGADGSTIEGFDVDLFKAVATKLGLKADFKNAGFDSIIPGVNSKKFDIGVSSFTINPERKKVVDMISYFNAGTQWASAPGNPKNVDPAKPCGVNVAVQTNTVQDQNDLPAKVKACGAKAPKIDRYDKQDEATAAVGSGKDDAMLADSPVIAYAVKQSKGKLEALGDIYDSAPYGYTVAKNNNKLSQAIVIALKELEADGTYKKVLSQWGVDQGAITDFAVNP